MTLSLPSAAGTLRGRLVSALAQHGHAVAVVQDDDVVRYADLAERVENVATRLGSTRRLVALEGERTALWLTAYLGALSAGCPVLLLPPGPAGAAVAAAYDPDVRIVLADGRVELDEVRAVPATPLHEDLALLLSTSGSSGSPKLVRLSRTNLLANAEAVAASLGVRADDRAITTLPVHYCYGLSVVHSHLLRGAALVLTERSVVEPEFWELFARAGATSLAGVPYTFDLLDQVGFADKALPTLRSVTQAGGRLAPERVRAYAELGRARGWDLHVMYGQTEATARMAVLPADLAIARPTSIGRPIDGGAFSLEPVDGGPPVAEGEVGELVYTGPNVMLGYAASRTDLARGAELDRLRTGDLARRCPDGLWEVVGRRGRFAKLFGLRLDQEHVEDQLRRGGIVACCEPTDDGRLGVAVQGDGAGVAGRVRSLTGLPAHAVHVVPVEQLPRGAAGKPDLPAVRALLAAPGAGAAATDVRGLFAEVLGVTPDDDDTFVGLGGDSLSYVEMTVRLEQLLGQVPPGWHALRVADLGPPAAQQVPGRSRTTIDTTVALRAAAILLVVGSHSKVFDVLGGAHLLLVLAGYDLARFQLTGRWRTRPASVARSLRRLAAPTALWSGAVLLAGGPYAWPNLLLANQFVGPREWGPTWNLWFLEALALLVVAVVALVTLRPVDRWQRHRPFAFALVLVAAGLLVRFDVLPVDTGPRERFTAQALLWLFALGMAAASARSPLRRVLVVALAAWGLHGWFGDVQRELVVLGGLALLVSVARLPGTRLLAAAASALASASLYVYVTHWQVYPLWQHELPLLALAASVAVGLAYQRAFAAGTRCLHDAAARWRAGARLPSPHADADVRHPRRRHRTRTVRGALQRR